MIGDAAATARALLDAGVRNAASATTRCAAEIAAGSWRDEPYEDARSDGRMDPRTLSIALDALLPDERTVAVDSGHFMGFPPMYLRVPDPAGFVFTQAFQSIGLGLASGIGAAIARPDRLTVACLGDGGALMSLPELETLARLRLPMLVVIYNDAAYGAEVHHFRPHGHPVELVQFPDTDFAALAVGRGRARRDGARRGGPRARSRPGSPRATARSSSMRRSRPTSARNGSRRPSDDPVARRDAVRRGRRRPHPAAERGHARPQAPAAVRQHAGADAPRDQRVRRPRPGVGVVLARDRRARRHALRRADPLGQRQATARTSPPCRRSGWSGPRS